MKIGNAQSPNHILAAAAIFIVVSASAEAATTILYCKGVNYIYQDGIGNGPAKRETASRTITLDLQAMTCFSCNVYRTNTRPLTTYRRYVKKTLSTFRRTVL